MKGYKGFNKGLICRGKQYAENTIFEEPEANICENGMHFCENPFDVLDYYGFVAKNGELNEFAEVEALDETQTDDNKKYCTTKLKIGAKLSLVEFVKMCAETAKDLNDSRNYVRVSSSEHGIQIGVTGWGSDVAIAGFNSKVASIGGSSTVASTGSHSYVVSTGDDSIIVSAGGYSTIDTAGDSFKIVSTGDHSMITAVGNKSDIVSTGDHSQVISTGTSCSISCTGIGSLVKAKRGSWITLNEWKYDSKKEVHVPVCVKTEYVDGERIKEDVFYILEDGEFREVLGKYIL